MKHLDLPQHSAEWFKARAGIPTASCADRIVTPKTLRPSAQADKYRHQLLAEWLLGTPFEIETKVWQMDRGLELEEEAISYFELTTGQTTQTCGLCLTDDGAVGASPDRFVGDEALLEIKCPLAPTHVGYLLADELPIEYLLQTQMQLYVTQRQCVWFLSYYPSLPPLLLRIEPEPVYQNALATALAEFCLRLEDGKRRLLERAGGTKAV